MTIPVYFVFIWKVMNRMLLAALSVAAILVSCSTSDDYRDKSLPADKRAMALLSEMTLEEKVGQLVCPLGWPMYEKVDTDSVAVSQAFKDFITNRKGGMLWATFRADPWTRKTLENGLNPTLAAKAYNALQRYAIENSRLGIPILLAEEASHGHMAIGTTVFPTSIGLASTWDPSLITSVGHSISSELRSQGGMIAYGPVIDLAREPRWSRVEETYGEDVYLTSSMAVAMVSGMSPKHNGWDKGVVSTLKHFAAYGIPEGGHNGNPSFVGERELMDNFLPPFKAAIDEGALSVMTSYNAIDGVPTTANPHLLRDILRGQWGFEGFVVSDLESVDGLYGSHHIAGSKAEAGEIALKAGVDVDLGANCFPSLVASVRNGRVDERVVNEAVLRVLTLKFELGLFDNPYIDETLPSETARTQENVSLARSVAREGVILLENDGVLPLSSNLKVAVIGPNADNIYNQLGDYTAPQPRENVVTVLDGIRFRIGDENVIYAKGCAIRDTLNVNIEEAVKAAKSADVAVVVVGGSSARDFKTKYIDTGAAVVDAGSVSDMESGEGFDRATLTLLGRQNELLKAVKKTGKPMVVVYIEGRPLDKRWAKSNADALLTMWYPGAEGGNALADVLFGDYNPAGRLPVSVPLEVGQLPVYYNKKFPKGHDYVEMSSEPLYAFGYGLSYTTFAYDTLQISVTRDGKPLSEKDFMGRDDVSEAPSPAIQPYSPAGREVSAPGSGYSVKVAVKVSNTGGRDGDEVVQLYVTDLQASVSRPQKQLRAFRRVNVKADASETVVFDLSEEDFALYNVDKERVFEPGSFVIAVGASSKDIRTSKTITLL